MNIIKDNIPNPTYITYVDKNGKTQKQNIRVGTQYKKTSITIHSTANQKSTAKNERAWLVNPTNNRVASWHWAVDQNDAVQAIPDTEIAYHAGIGSGNTSSIGIEICESGDRLKTLQNAVELTIMLLKQHQLTTKDLRKHYDWTKKNCPRILIDKTQIKDNLDWNWFVAQVEKGMTQKHEKTLDWREKAYNEAIAELVKKGKLSADWLNPAKVKQFTENETQTYKDALPAWLVFTLLNRQ